MSVLVLLVQNAIQYIICDCSRLFVRHDSVFFWSASVCRWKWAKRRLVSIINGTLYSMIICLCNWQSRNIFYRYVLYKLPRLAHSNPKIAEGVAYLYITSETKNSKSWTLSDYAITDAKSIPGRTLSPLFLNEHSNDIDVRDERWKNFSQSLCTSDAIITP